MIWRFWCEMDFDTLDSLIRSLFEAMKSFLHPVTVIAVTDCCVYVDFRLFMVQARLICGVGNTLNPHP
jgi:hypothetical protein